MSRPENIFLHLNITIILYSPVLILLSSFENNSEDAHNTDQTDKQSQDRPLGNYISQIQIF